MFCPNCERALNKIDITTNQGGRFQVDHCGYCGGTWFDPYEINRIPYHEVMTLAGVTVMPHKKPKTASKMLCPNDHLPLDKHEGDAVPSGVNLLWCKKCLGIWASQKDLIGFKNHQEETISAYDEGNKFFPKLSVVFVPAMTFLFLLAATFSTITSLQKSREARIFAESQILDLNVTSLPDETAFLSFSTVHPVKSSVYYGKSSLEMNEMLINLTPATSHNIVLPDLTPNTEYIYKIVLEDNLGNTFTSDPKSFKTQ